MKILGLGLPELIIIAAVVVAIVLVIVGMNRRKVPGAPQQTTRYCPQCGTELPAAASFCKQCGTQVPSGTSTTVQQPIGNTSSTTAAERKSGRRRVGIAAAAVFALAIIAVAASVAGGGISLLLPTKTLADYSWDELADISTEMSQVGSEAEALEIAKRYGLLNSDGKLDGAQRKTITLESGREVNAVIAGFLHDDLADGSGKAGITFFICDAIDIGRAMNGYDSDDYFKQGSNVGGWEQSEMREWLSGGGLALLPSDLQSNVKSVRKMTNNVGKTNSPSAVSATVDRLWLLSYEEITGTGIEAMQPQSGEIVITGTTISVETASEANAVLEGEGEQYRLFRDTGYQSDEISEAIIEKRAGWWWLRSPVPFTEGDFFSYDNDHGLSFGSSGSSYSAGVYPGFCL